MSDQNKAILSRIFEIMSQGNLADLDEVVAANVIDHNPEPGQAPGLEGVRQALTMWRVAFPDLEMVAEDMIAEGDKVVARLVMRGTNSGEFMGMPSTGKEVSITGVEIARIAGGKTVERWGQFDGLGMMMQLGLMAQPE